MPELPEVEIMTRNATRWLVGERIEAFEIVDERVVVEGAAHLAQLQGDVVRSAWRRAKHLALRTDSASLAVHFRMTGKLVLGPHPGRVRWWLRTESGRRVDYVDARCLGDLRAFPPTGAQEWLDGLGLGPEPYPELQTGTWWRERFDGARSAIKVALMDQARIAGIGNILASEILWNARVHPFRKPATLTDGEWHAIAGATPAFIDLVINEESADEIVYVGESRDAGSTFAVYAREGEQCLRCEGTVRRVKQSGRSTFYCDHCQVA